MVLTYDYSVQYSSRMHCIVEALHCSFSTLMARQSIRPVGDTNPVAMFVRT